LHGPAEALLGSGSVADPQLVICQQAIDSRHGIGEPLQYA